MNTTIATCSPSYSVPVLGIPYPTVRPLATTTLPRGLRGLSCADGRVHIAGGRRERRCARP